MPKFDDFYNPAIQMLQDGELHDSRSITQGVIIALNISEADASQRLQSGRTVVANRVSWVLFNLKKAGIVESPLEGKYRITIEGKKLSALDIVVSTAELIARYPSFAKMMHRKPQEENGIPTTENQSESPQETLERVYGSINAQLADDLLAEIMRRSAAFFESLVVDLMRTMGYGDGFVTKYSGDNGIDGIIHEDKLGFNLIYIQAKRWNPDTTIGRPEIQKFVGAMMGPPKIEKGLFITTAKFSQEAKEYAKAQHIILVDGARLTELMIEHGLGVSIVRTYYVKRIDTDYFSDDI